MKVVREIVSTAESLEGRARERKKVYGKADKVGGIFLGLLKILSTFARLHIGNCRINQFGLYEFHITENRKVLVTRDRILWILANNGGKMERSRFRAPLRGTASYYGPPSVVARIRSTCGRPG
ncbi:Uncharacterised protein [uncultured archaeon]|nr:Uncharacterised protein [uncultured archaeon]